MWNRVVSDLLDTASSGSYLGDLIQPEPGLIRAVCWVTFYNEYLMCLQGSGPSIWNVCNCLCVQMAASCVHVGSRFLLRGYCFLLIRPRCMLSIGYSAEILYLGVVNQIALTVPAIWLNLPFQSYFSVVSCSPRYAFYVSLATFLFLLIPGVFRKFVENVYYEKNFAWISNFWTPK